MLSTVDIPLNFGATLMFLLIYYADDPPRYYLFLVLRWSLETEGITLDLLWRMLEFSLSEFLLPLE
jgi:hypothetical protein